MAEQQLNEFNFKVAKNGGGFAEVVHRSRKSNPLKAMREYAEIHGLSTDDIFQAKAEDPVQIEPSKDSTPKIGCLIRNPNANESTSNSMILKPTDDNSAK